MDKQQIIIDEVNVSGCYFLSKGVTNLLCTCPNEIDKECKYNSNCYFKQLQRKIAECEKLKKENEELNDRMAEVTYRATGGRLSYSSYTLDAIEQAFNDQLEILSDRKVEEEIKELEQKNEEMRNKIKKLRKNLALEIETNDHYRKALDEIEELVSKWYEDYVIQYRDDYDEIISIISKAKENNNE